MRTQLLEKAFVEAAKLPEQEQNSFAEWLIEELASDARWDKAFSHSAEKLAALAQEAMTEFRSGKTQPIELDPQ